MGSTLRINGEAFELIGIFDEKSGRQYVNTNRPDNQVLVVPTTRNYGLEHALRFHTCPRVDYEDGVEVTHGVRVLGVEPATRCTRRSHCSSGSREL